MKRQKEKARKAQLKKQGGQKKDSSSSENTSDEEDDAEGPGSCAEKKPAKKTDLEVEWPQQKKTKAEPIVVSCTVDI